ncbi:transglycosylase SLT domain-containing protein [Kitasatospora sp. NPDC002227]|uniref:transglycosylase SLT domain-containing protein n=1 Tax=Kitasatospora sp. NPDC002227 TaxID=3154773 RepID=UPI0033266452
MTEQYHVSPDQLDGLAGTWQGEAAKLEQVVQRVHAVLGEFGKAELTTLLSRGLVAAELVVEVERVVKNVGERAAKLTGRLHQDGEGISRCASNYREADAEAARHLHHGGKRGSVPPPKHPTEGDKGGQGGHGGGQGGHGGGTGGGTGSGTGGGDGGGSPAPLPKGDYANREQVMAWINQAFDILKANGVPADKLNAEGVLLMIEHESSGNPHAINNWDSNAKAGHPSKGLMQTIDSTFQEHTLPGHGDIYNPVDNIIAGTRYALSTYGSIDNVPGVKAVAHGKPYVGY